MASGIGQYPNPPQTHPGFLKKNLNLSQIRLLKLNLVPLGKVGWVPKETHPIVIPSSIS